MNGNPHWKYQKSEKHEFFVPLLFQFSCSGAVCSVFHFHYFDESEHKVARHTRANCIYDRIMTELSSEGFDLDAVGEGSGDVKFEIGGGATVVPEEPPPSAPETQTISQLDEAENWKNIGNEEFKKKNYLEAYDMYTKAIETCPCEIKAEEVLRQRDEFEEMEREKARSRMDEETRQRKRETTDTVEKEFKESEKPQGPASFELEPQENGDKLAIFYNNRAASLIQLMRFEEAIRDADVAILLNPKYAKAYVRRSSAFEKTERTEEALRDMKQALQLEPSNKVFRKSVTRLQKMEDERLEKLKAETMDKLKDLGNSLLGNFGLSLDNFQTVQDPNTGSYSISFNQNK